MSPSRGETSRYGSHAWAAADVSERLVGPRVSASNNRDNENRRCRSSQDATQGRSERQPIEPGSIRNAHDDQIRIAAFRDVDDCAINVASHCSERNGGSHREIDGRQNASKPVRALCSCFSLWQHEHWYRRPTRQFARYPGGAHTFW